MDTKKRGHLRNPSIYGGPPETRTPDPLIKSYPVYFNNTILLVILLAFLSIWTSLLLSCPAFAGEWTKADTAREVAYLALHVADWGQTLEIADHPEKWHENNPVLGDHPSRGQVNAYFIATGLLHPVVSYGLRKYTPDGWVQAWQYVTIGIEVGATANNLKLGIGFGF